MVRSLWDNNYLLGGTISVEKNNSVLVISLGLAEILCGELFVMIDVWQVKEM